MESFWPLDKFLIRAATFKSVMILATKVRGCPVYGKYINIEKNCAMMLPAHRVAPE